LKRIIAVLVCLLLVLSVSLTAQAQPLLYTDVGAIRNLDAVSMLTDLELLEGDENHAFRPDGLLTRAEVSKLAALISTASPVASRESPFVDIDRCWAREYISYGHEQGFLAGCGYGRFAPDDHVTAQELVKMLLGAIGYDLSDMTGSDWGVRINALANELNIYNGYDVDPSRPISRDYAARLTLNVLNCSTVSGYENGEPVYVVDDLLNPVTVLESRFGVLRYQQVITANEFADLSNPDAPLEAGWTKLYGHYPMTCSTTLADLGRTVTVYLRDGQVVGVPVYDPAEFCVTVDGSDNLNQLCSDGGYTLAPDAAIYLNGVAADADALDALDSDHSITLIDYESDDVIDTVLVWHWQHCRVVQSSPLVYEIPGGGTRVAPETVIDEEATEVSALRINDQWVVRSF